MPTTLVSLVSEQTIPNILLIKELTDVSSYLFVYTKEMLSELKNIIDSTKIEAPTLLKVDSNDLRQMRQQLHQLSLSEEVEYLVNITGGNKLMSLAVYQHFMDFNSKVYYLPIGTNTYQQIYPFIEEEKPILYTLSVKEYLQAYGATIITRQTELTKEKGFTYTFARRFIEHTYSTAERDLLRRILLKEEPPKSIVSLPHLEQFLNKYQIIISENRRFDLKVKKYLTSGWFEEYLYSFFKQYLNISDKHILIGIQVEYKGEKNEYDVMFMKNNRLHVIECKTGESLKLRNIIAPIYKSGALKGNLGLDMKFYLFSLIDEPTSAVSEIQKNLIVGRAKQIKIELIDRGILKDESKLIETIQNI